MRVFIIALLTASVLSIGGAAPEGISHRGKMTAARHWALLWANCARADRPDLAIASCNALVGHGARSYVVHTHLGEHHLGAGHLKKAEENFRSALRISHWTPAEHGLSSVYIIRARKAMTEKNIVRAYMFYEEAVRLNPYNEDALPLLRELMLAPEYGRRTIERNRPQWNSR